MFIVKKNTGVITATLAIAISGIAAILGWTYLAQQTSAADMSKFDPGNIMSDAVMSNKDSMNVQQIQAFLDSKNACNNTNTYMAIWYPHLQYTIRDGKFVCMAKDSFNGKSAAQIIWQAGQDYAINPQFLIVLLEKEQGLITDTWPNNIQYRSATGFGCPDTAACDSQYFGLENQIRNAANLFRTVLSGGWSNYPVGQTYVQYHPNTSCGGSVVNIQNRTTSALYRYTPYQPNQSVLNAGYGLGDACGAYGNRNTWGLFTDWFGSTTHIGADSITNKYTTMGGNLSWLGTASSEVRLLDAKNGLYQTFEKGNIYWSNYTGAWSVRNGAVSNRYAQVYGERGYLGYPRSDENAIRKNGIQTGIWQAYEGGQMYWSPDNGAWDIRYGAMFNRYRETGFEGGHLGYPKSSEVAITPTVTYQEFEGGRLYWQPNHPARNMDNNILEGYKNAGADKGYLGRPTTNLSCGIKDGGCWQGFEKGKVYWSAESGSYDIYRGAIDHKYAELKYEGGPLGYPTSREIPTGTTCGPHKDVRQEFQGGTVYWSACSSPSVRVELGTT